jgi:hypothetical protein
LRCWTRPQIGRAFERDHTTALNSMRLVNAALAGLTFGDEMSIADVARDVLAAMAARAARKDADSGHGRVTCEMAKMQAEKKEPAYG